MFSSFFFIISSPYNSQDKFITYAGVCNLAETLFELLGPLLSFHFTPSKFLSFRRNPIGGISSIVYFTAICQRNLRLQLKLLLLNYDKCGDGMISLEDFDSALDEIVEKRMIQDIPLPKSGFIASWKKIVTHKFVVQLLKTRSMKEESQFSIKSILKSDAFRELTELPSLAMSIFYNGPFAKRIEANWFSLQSTQRVHRAFLNLDQDNDMFITRKEFMRLEPGMTDIFVDRIFSEHVSSFDNYSSNQSAPKLSLKRRSSVLLMRKTIANMRKSKRGCMSYDDYLTFMVAWSNKRSPYALKYFFRVFDLEKRGLLTHVEIHTFFREVFSKYVENNQYNDIRMEDVRDEIFDMVNQEVPGQITQKDILSSGVQEILVDVLSDYNGFWRYDNREYLMQMEEEEEEQ